MLLYFLGALKAAIIALCVLAGVDLIASGFGVQLTSLEYKGLKAMGIPIGIVAMLVGVFGGQILAHQSDSDLYIRNIQYGRKRQQ